jgi:hypothetical protein
MRAFVTAVCAHVCVCVQQGAYAGSVFLFVVPMIFIVGITLVSFRVVALTRRSVVQAASDARHSVYMVRQTH